MPASRCGVEPDLVHGCRARVSSPGRAARALSIACALALTTLAVGCSGPRLLRAHGWPEADVYVENPPRSGLMAFVGRTKVAPERSASVATLDYGLPERLVNQVLKVEVRTSESTYAYRVYTDRAVTVLYPPEGHAQTEANAGVVPLAPGAPAASGAPSTSAVTGAPGRAPRPAAPREDDGFRDDRPAASIAED